MNNDDADDHAKLPNETERPVPPVTPVAPPAGDVDKSDEPPPLAIRGRGPMDQTVPDVATGSTPVTRRDD